MEKSILKYVALPFMWVVSSLCFTGCINDPSDSPFQFSIIDKQGCLNDEEDIMIWGSYKEKNLSQTPENVHLFIGENKEKGAIMKNSGGQWSFEDGHIPNWPMGESRFDCYLKAISPSYDESFKIVQTPDNPLEYMNILAELTIPSSARNQRDIKVGTTILSNFTFYSPCFSKYSGSLLFSHILSKVTFTGLSYSKTSTISVSNIEITNVHQHGRSGNTPKGMCIALDNAVHTFRAELADNYLSLDTIKTILSHSEYPLFMLPQKVAKWTTTAKNPVPTTEADKNHNSYMKVTCTVKDKASNVVLIDNGAIYIPLEVNWDMNKAYEYIIEYGKSSNCFNAKGTKLKNIPLQVIIQEADWN